MRYRVKNDAGDREKTQGRLQLKGWPLCWLDVIGGKPIR